MKEPNEAELCVLNDMSQRTPLQKKAAK